MLIFSGQKVVSARIYTFPCLAVLALSQHSLNTNQNWVNTSPGQKHTQWSQKNRQWSWKYDQLSWLFLRRGSWGRIGGALGGGVGDKWGGGSVPMHACMSSSLCVLLMIIILSADSHHVITREGVRRSTFWRDMWTKNLLTIFKHIIVEKVRMKREALEMDQHRW